MFSEKNELLYEIEKWFIERYSPTAGKAIDIGAGTGTYSNEIIRQGCTVTLIDICEKQLEEAIGFIAKEGLAGRVDGSHIRDASNLFGIEGNFFDFAICFGMLNFTLQNEKKVLNEINRVLKPGSSVIISAMSIWGYIASSWKNDGLEDKSSIDQDVMVLQTGINASVRPFRKLYTSEELERLAERAGFEMIEIASAPTLSTFLQTGPARYRKNEPSWDHIVSMEKKACLVPGLRDIGTNILVVAKKKPG